MCRIWGHFGVVPRSQMSDLRIPDVRSRISGSRGQISGSRMSGSQDLGVRFGHLGGVPQNTTFWGRFWPLFSSKQCFSIKRQNSVFGQNGQNAPSHPSDFQNTGKQPFSVKQAFSHFGDLGCYQFGSFLGSFWGHFGVIWATSGSQDLDVRISDVKMSDLGVRFGIWGVPKEGSVFGPLDLRGSKSTPRARSWVWGVGHIGHMGRHAVSGRFGCWRWCQRTSFWTKTDTPTSQI